MRKKLIFKNVIKYFRIKTLFYLHLNLHIVILMIREYFDNGNTY